MKRSASEVVASGQLFVAVEADEEHVPYAVSCMGDDLWLFSTDYPHGGSPWPEGVKLISEMGISEDAKVKLLSKNALRFIPRLAGVVPSLATVGA